MRLLLAGDTHNDLSHAEYLIQVCKENEIGYIIQLGDWGFQWPRLGRIDDLQWILNKASVHMSWIRGNHEGYPALKRDHYLNADHLCRMGPNLTYVPDGQTFALGGVMFGALGGAVSIDRRDRVAGESWWPEEVTTQAQVDRLTTRSKLFPIDVLLTHDAPPLPIWDRTLKTDPGSEDNRGLILQAAENTQPDLIYHGHMHVRHTSPLRLKSGKVVRVEGLAHNGTGLDSWCILDTDAFRASKHSRGV